MKGNQWLGAGLGVVVLFIFLLLPPFEPITQLGMKVLGVFLFTVFWWLFVDTSFPSLLCVSLFALLGIMTPNEVFAVALGNWIVMFLISCFGLTEAIRLSGFTHRFALWFLTRPFTAGHPWLTVVLFLFGVTLMSAVMSPTVTVILFISLVAPMLEGMGYKKGDLFPAMLIMGIGWSALAAFVATPIGHVTNLIFIDWIRRDANFFLSFPEWLVVGVPMALLVYLLLLGFFHYIVRPDMSRFSAMTEEYIQKEAGKTTPLKTEEKFALGVFLGVVICWMLPGVTGDILPGVSSYFDKMGFAIPPLVGTILLHLIRVRNQPLLTFRQWTTSVDWATIALVAAIMAIGSVIGKPETGIPQFMTDILQPVTNAPFLVVVLVSVTWVVLQTNVMSNIVSATVVYTIIMPAVIADGVGNPIALGFTIFAGSHYAFCLPSATTVTAIITGSGWVPVKFLAGYGALTVIPIILLLTFVCYPLASIIFR